jgi:hypothetical protein
VFFYKSFIYNRTTNTTTTSEDDNTTQIITVTDSAASELRTLCALISVKIFADTKKMHIINNCIKALMVINISIQTTQLKILGKVIKWYVTFFNNTADPCCS